MSGLTKEQMVAEENRVQRSARPGKYRILILPTIVYVKDAAFFATQGGLTEEWGQDWIEIEAESLHDAREKGKRMRDGN